MRSIKQFLESIQDDEIRFSAIQCLTEADSKNLGKYRLGNEICKNLQEALSKAFRILKAEHPSYLKKEERIKFWLNIRYLSQCGKIEHSQS